MKTDNTNQHIRTLELVGVNMKGEQMFKLRCPCCTVVTYGTKEEFNEHSRQLKLKEGNQS